MSSQQPDVTAAKTFREDPGPAPEATNNPIPESNSNDGQRRRRPYCAPAMVELGDIRTVTLGGSIGAGDSGDTGTKALFGFD